MPIYEFKCRDCGSLMEALRRMDQGPEGLICPKCESKNLERALSTFAAAPGQAADPGCGKGADCGKNTGFG